MRPVLKTTGRRLLTMWDAARACSPEEVARVLAAGAKFVVSVDTGLSHSPPRFRQTEYYAIWLNGPRVN